MADFVAVLKKTIDSLADGGPAMREKVYEKARATVAAKLAGITPPPPAAVADRQRQALEDAIREVEAGYANADPDPFAELEDMLGGSAPRQEPAAATRSEPTAADAPALAGSHADPRPWPDQYDGDEAETTGVEDERPGVPFDGEEEPVDDEDDIDEEPARRRNFMPLVAAVVALVLVAGGAYAVWINKDDFLAMLGMGGETVATAPPAAGAPAPEAPVADAPATDAAPATARKPATEPADAAPPTETAAPADEQGVQKFTQRLNDDGSETDDGPAGGIASIGEGTSVAAVTQPPQPAVADPAAPGSDTAAAPDSAAPASDAATATAPALPTDPAAPTTTAAAPASESDAQVAVGQKAIFYEERTNVAEGSAEPGNVVWSIVQESPGNELPPEPAIRGEATIPGKDIQLRMTIRRNADKTLPASHIIELIFLTPDDFEGGGIENILRFALKDTEAAAGSPVLGMPAKIADGFFLVALNDTKAEVETNMGLFKRERWIDVPLVYKSGRRALITLEKGLPGDKVFDEAIKAWQTATASAG